MLKFVKKINYTNLKTSTSFLLIFCFNLIYFVFKYGKMGRLLLDTSREVYIPMAMNNSGDISVDY